MKIPRRTGSTGLTDSELMILDFLVDMGAAVLSALSNEKYKLHMNCQYSHDLSDVELFERVEDLINRGFIERRLSDEERSPSYWLTPQGGELWEVERRADWNLYCRDTQWDDDENSVTLEIACLTLEIGKAFAQTAQKCDLFSIDPNRFSLRMRESDTELVNWKLFPVVHYLRFKVEEEVEPLRTDWGRYESERVWWRTLNELDTIKF